MFKFKKRDIEKSPDLAERIFNYRTYQPYVNECPDLEVKKICKDCKSIQDSLNKVIEYCGEPNSAKARYYYAITYAWSRKEYNDLAIEYLTLYLNNPPYDKKYGNKTEEPNIHLYEMWRYLGQAYEKNKNLDEALNCYFKCLEYLESFQVPYLDIANIYRKKNDLNSSLEILNNAKSTQYYKNDFKEVIDRYILDYEEKIKKGYKYKARKVC